MTRPRWCPTCGRLTYSEGGYCPVHEARAGEQRFGNCRFCGCTIDRQSTTCRRCRDLPGLDSEPADPLESLPLMAADIVQGEDSQTPEGKVS